MTSARLPVGHQPRREIASKELDDRRDVLLVSGHGGDVRRRLDPEHGHAGLLKVLQQIAVVAGDLDDETLGAEPALVDE